MIKKILLLLSLLFIWACTKQDIIGYEDVSGFHPKQSYMQPISGKTLNPMATDFIIPNAKNKTIIIWNHGTNDSFKQTNCRNWGSLPPESIMDFNNDNTSVYYLCSQITDLFAPTTYTIRRGYEIETVLDKLISAGVNPKNIWIAGQSAGAWSTLLMSNKAKKKFNGAILFAPACCGTKKAQKFREKQHDNIFDNIYYGTVEKSWNEAHKQQLNQFNSLRQKAIIFTFADDSYNTKKDFLSLKQAHPNTITLKQYNCGQGHASNRRNCKKEQIKADIRKFMNKY